MDLILLQVDIPRLLKPHWSHFILRADIRETPSGIPLEKLLSPWQWFWQASDVIQFDTEASGSYTNCTNSESSWILWQLTPLIRSVRIYVLMSTQVTPELSVNKYLHMNSQEWVKTNSLSKAFGYKQLQQFRWTFGQYFWKCFSISLFSRAHI